MNATQRKCLLGAVAIAAICFAVFFYHHPDLFHSAPPPPSNPTVDEIIAQKARDARKEINEMEKRANELRDKARQR